MGCGVGACVGCVAKTGTPNGEQRYAQVCKTDRCSMQRRSCGNDGLCVNFGGVLLKNPVIAASGTFGYGREYNEFFPVSMLGGISCKGTTLEDRLGQSAAPYRGNPVRDAQFGRAAKSRRQPLYFGSLSRV